MKFDEKENKESLGASHVPGGCNGKAKGSVELNWASPRNEQDYSDVNFSQPSSLRSDRCAAPGLTISVTKIRHSLLEVAHLTVLRIKGLSDAIVYKAKFTWLVHKHRRMNSIGYRSQRVCDKGENMAAVLGKGLNGDFISERLEGKLDEVKQQLEGNFQNTGVLTSAVEEINEIRNIIGNPERKKKNLLDLAKQIDQAASKILAFLQRYEDCLSDDASTWIESTADNFKKWAKLCRAGYAMPNKFSSESGTEAFKKWAIGIELFAELIDDAENLPIKSLNIIEKVASAAFEVASFRKHSDSKKDRYSKRIQYAAAFIIQKIEKVKAEKSEDLIIGNEPLPELLRKSQERIKLLGWPETDEEAERLITEEESQDDKSHKTLEYLNKLLGNN